MRDANEIHEGVPAPEDARSGGLAWAQAGTVGLPVLYATGQQEQTPQAPSSAPVAPVASRLRGGTLWRRLRAWAGPAAVVLATATLTALAVDGVFDQAALLNPVVAVIVEVTAGLALAASWWSRRVRWWRWRLPVSVLVAGAVTGAVAGWLRLSGTVTDAYPPTFAVWVTLALTALVGCWWTLRRGGQARRTLALAAVPLTLCGGFLLINDEYGLWPTLGDLMGHGTTTADLYTLLHLPPGTHPSKGVVASIDVPATRSHFTHRPGSVYLPPAFFDQFAATLPVIVMLGGAPGNSTHWISAGHAVDTADAYAKAHHGYAPIMIFVDHNGSSTGDTECVDGPRGNAETFLTVDVPAFVSKTLKVKPVARRWAVVGFSEGGTCALDLTLGHPTVFNHFADLAGDLVPNLGNQQQTLSALFGGSTAAQAAHDPMKLLAIHHYKGFSAWFAAGAADPNKIALSKRFAAAARPAGFTVHEFTGTGGHNWQFASDAFRRILPELCRELGIKH